MRYRFSVNGEIVDVKFCILYSPEPDFIGIIYGKIFRAIYEAFLYEIIRGPITQRLIFYVREYRKIVAFSSALQVDSAYTIFFIDKLHDLRDLLLAGIITVSVLDVYNSLISTGGFMRIFNSPEIFR